MAGGIGSRFWPKSRVDKPKQFLSFFGKQSLLQTTVSRIAQIIPYEQIIVSTNADYGDLVKEQLPQLPAENIIKEPVGKNTAPCIAFAAGLIYQRSADSTMVVLPSDHHITDASTFLDDIQTGIEVVHQNPNKLVTIGITPTRPETGYGYIQFKDSSGSSLANGAVYPVKTFAEKPDLQTALKFIQSGDFLWNSGMFIWKTKTILDEIDKHLPVLSHQTRFLIDDLSDKAGKLHTKTLKQVYDNCLPISVDYGIMEKSEHVLVLPARFSWSDLGSWMSVYELLREEADENGNVMRIDKGICIESENNFVTSRSDKLLVLVGIQGIGIIETEDAVLVCKLDQSQQVKEVYSKIKTDDLNHLQ